MAKTEKGFGNGV